MNHDRACSLKGIIAQLIDVLNGSVRESCFLTRMKLQDSSRFVQTTFMKFPKEPRLHLIE